MIGLFYNFHHILVEVAFALLPLVVAFVFFQIFLLKLSFKKIKRILQGLILTYIGLALFLQGVHVGYLPVGQMMGEKLASLSYNWILIPIGLVLGFTATLAEPAVRVLITEVEKVTGGYINKTLMLYALCIGVGVAVGLSMLRVITGVSIIWFIAPLYITAFILTRFTSQEFTAVAFDSGGVATGPMTVTFILSLTVGVADSIADRNVLMDGFGMVALVAIMPIITILALGVLYSVKEGAGDKK